jgi:hypothetical protein
LSPKVHNISFAKSFIVNQPTNPSKNQTENNPKRTYRRNQEQLPPLPMPLGEMYKLELTYEYHARNPSHIIHLLNIQEEALAIIQSRVNNF